MKTLYKLRTEVLLAELYQGIDFREAELVDVGAGSLGLSPMRLQAAAVMAGYSACKGQRALKDGCLRVAFVKSIMEPEAESEKKPEAQE